MFRKTTFLKNNIEKKPSFLNLGKFFQPQKVEVRKKTIKSTIKNRLTQLQITEKNQKINYMFVNKITPISIKH